jgi:predicted acetyltransferase
MKWFLTNPRAARVTGITDFLWVRLLDVPRFLGARRYERDGDHVLEVIDDLDGEAGPAAGRYRLRVVDGAATCERTTDAPDLTVDVGALSAASLGGTRLRDASRTLRHAEHQPGALLEVEAMLLTAEPPWCSTWF